MNNRYDITQSGGLIPGAEPDEIIKRFEKVPVSIYNSGSEGANYAAGAIVNAINGAAAKGEKFVL